MSFFRKFWIILKNQILFGFRSAAFLILAACLGLPHTLSADEEGSEVVIPLSLGGSFSPLGGFFEVGPILDQFQVEAAFDEQVSDSLVDDVEEEVQEFVEDTVEDELAVDIEQSFVGEVELGIAIIADDVINTLDEDIDYESARFHSGQWLVMADSMVFEELAQEGFVFDSFRELPSLGFVLAEVSAPSSFNITIARQGVHNVVGTDRAIVDFNHYYTAGLSVDSPDKGFQPASAMELPNDVDQLSLKLGVIDSLVDVTHPGLKSSRIEVEHFTRRGIEQPADHGTAVASIIAASGKHYAGLAPKAEIFAASVFEVQRHHGETANAVSLIRALDWLLSKDIDVVNVSMAGPPNKLLELALKKFEERGIPVVAAAGNGGPSADPMFPAAYEDVIAVTAVDAQSKAFRLANRGSYVDLAAPGVDVRHLKPGNGYGTSSGTSFAVPFVSTAVAIMKHQHPYSDPAKILFESAKDLGEPGKDDIYGYGLVSP